MVILALIVKRVRIKALVKDKQATVEAFGSYVEVNYKYYRISDNLAPLFLIIQRLDHIQPVTGDLRNKSILKKASTGIRAVICPTNVSDCFRVH